jgi:hypothetical protein
MASDVLSPLRYKTTAAVHEIIVMVVAENCVRQYDMRVEKLALHTLLVRKVFAWSQATGLTN